MSINVSLRKIQWSSFILFLYNTIQAVKYLDGSSNLNTDIRALIKRNLAEIRPYLDKNHISAYRLIDNIHPGIPLAADIYENNAVIQLFGRVNDTILNNLCEYLHDNLDIVDIFFKNRSKEDMDIPASTKKKIILEEYSHKFIINLSDYLDTGLFLDHRETRKWIESLSRGKTVLNTFAYTGSFSVYAACGGAAATYSVDLSRVYCEWIKENLALNGHSPDNNLVYKMDTLEFLRYARKKSLVFDIIIIDPPTFSKNRGKSFSVQKDHVTLINEALEVLSPEGFILFSNNYREFRINHREIKASGIKEKKNSIPPDFSGSIPHRCFIISR